MHRPASITVFGILNIVLGALGIVAPFVSIALSGLLKNDPVFRLMQENEGFQLYQKVAIPIGLVVSIALLICGVGLLRLRPWARLWAIIYSYYVIVASVVNPVISYYVYLRPMMEQMDDLEPQMQAMFKVTTVAGLVGGACFAVGYAVLLLIFMNRRPARLAFGLEKEIYDDDEGSQGGMRHEPYDESGNPYESP